MANPSDKTLLNKASVRNNNPGALDYEPSNNWVGRSGRDGRFDQFMDEVYGFRAQAMTIMKYTSHRGIRTFGEVTSRYAPTYENDTGAYKSFIESKLDISRGDEVVFQGTKYMRPEVALHLSEVKARMEAAGSRPMEAAWDRAKYNIGMAMALARRGTEYLAAARAEGNAAGEQAALKLLATAKKLDPYAAEAELKRGDAPVSHEQLRQEVSQLTANYESGKIKAYAGPDSRQELAKEAFTEAFSAPGKAMEKLDARDMEQVAGANDYAGRLKAYAKEKGVEMGDVSLSVGASEEEKKNFFGELDKAAKTLVEQNKHDDKAPLYKPDGDKTATVGSAQQQYEKDAAAASAARASEDRDRQDTQQRNDFANMGLSTDDMFLLGLLLMAFGHGDLARQLFAAAGGGGGGHGPGGGAPARDYRRFDRGSSDGYGNVPTFTPGVKPEPKLFNFIHKDGSPLLQLPVKGKVTTLERQNDTDRFTLEASGAVMAPANATIKAIDGKSVTLEWQQNGKTFAAVISGLESVRDGLKVGQIVNRGDELGAAKGTLSLQVLRDGVALEPLYAGVDRTKPATLDYDLSRKDYERREFEENNRLEKGYNSDRKTDVIISGKDERHHAYDGNSGLPENNGQLPGQTRSNAEVQRLPLFEMPDAVKEAAAKSANGWVQTHIVDGWDKTSYVGRYVFYHKDATSYLADVGEGKKYKDANEAMQAAKRDGLILVQATSGGGKNIEDRVNGRTPFTVQEDDHPDPDVLAIPKTGVVRPLHNYPNIIGEEIFFPRSKGGDSRGGFMTHRETRGGEIGSSGCLTVDWPAYLAAKQKLGLSQNEVFMLHPNVATRGPTRYKEIDPDFVAAEAKRGNAVTASPQLGTVVASNAQISANPNQPYWAALDSQGRLIAGNMVNAPADPASTTKMATLLTISDMVKRGELSGTFLMDHRSTIQSMMVNSNNDAAREVGRLAAKASGLVEKGADDSTADKGFALRMNKMAADYGLRNTLYTNPEGMPYGQHQSTVADMARMQRAISIDPIHRRVVEQFGRAENSHTGGARFTEFGDTEFGKTGTASGNYGRITMKNSGGGAKAWVGAAGDGTAYAVAEAYKSEWGVTVAKAAVAAQRGRNASPLTDEERGIVRPAPERKAEVPQAAGSTRTAEAVPYHTERAEIPSSLRYGQRGGSYEVKVQEGAEKSIAYDRSKPSFAVLDKNGALVGGNTPFDPAMPASVMKTAIILTGYDMEKKGELPKGYMAANADKMAHFMAESDNGAAKEFARKLAKEAGLKSADGPQQAFCNRMNQMFAERGMMATHINSIPSGGGASNAHDMAQLVYQLNRDYPQAKALYRVQNDRWIERNLGDDAESLRTAGAPEVGKIGALATGNGRISNRGSTAYSWAAGNENSTYAVAEAARGELADVVRRAGEMARAANQGIGSPQERAVATPKAESPSPQAPAQPERQPQPEAVPSAAEKASETADDKPIILVVDRGHGKSFEHEETKGKKQLVRFYDTGAKAVEGEAAPNGRTTQTPLTERQAVEEVSLRLNGLVADLEKKLNRKVKLVFSDNQDNPADRFQERVDVTRQYHRDGYEVYHVALHADRPRDGKNGKKDFAEPAVAMDFRAPPGMIPLGEAFAEGYHASIDIPPSRRSENAYHGMVDGRGVNEQLFPRGKAQPSVLVPHSTTLIQYVQTDAGTEAVRRLERPIPKEVMAVLIEMDDIRNLAAMDEAARKKAYDLYAQGLMDGTARAYAKRRELEQQQQQTQAPQRRSSLEEPADKIKQQLASLDLLWMGAIADSEKRRVAEAADKERAATGAGDTIDGALSKVASLDSARKQVSGGNDAKPEDAQAKPAVPNTKVAENTKDQKSSGASATV